MDELKFVRDAVFDACRHISDEPVCHHCRALIEVLELEMARWMSGSLHLIANEKVAEIMEHCAQIVEREISPLYDARRTTARELASAIRREKPSFYREVPL